MLNQVGLKIITVIILLTLIIPSAYWHYIKQAPQGAPKKIAFLYAHTSNYHEPLYSHFSQLCRTEPGINVDFVTTTTTSNQLLIMNICEKLTTEPFDCIVVIGKQLSQMLINMANKKQCTTPIVFVGVDTPVELGLVNSLDHPGGTATGLFTTGLDGDLYGRLLSLALPNIKRVLLPYYAIDDTNDRIKKWTTAIQEFLHTHNIHTFIAPIDAVPNALTVIESSITQCDALMTLEGDPISNQLTAGLAKLAEQHHIPFFTSTHIGITEGAVLAYAIQPLYAAETALNLVKQIVYHHQHPGTIPVVRLSSSREFIINTKRATELGITLDINHILHTINTDQTLKVVRSRVRIM